MRGCLLSVCAASQSTGRSYGIEGESNQSNGRNDCLCEQPIELLHYPEHSQERASRPLARSSTVTRPRRAPDESRLLRIWPW